MKLEVGMYVRTKHNGIGKIVEYINDPTCYFFKCYKLDRDCSNCDEYITKADVIEEPSHNIKELLQVGDFVDYEYPSGLGMWYYKNIEITEHLLNVFKNGENNHEYKITSIVTKEQFEQIQYKVGE